MKNIVTESGKHIKYTKTEDNRMGRKDAVERLKQRKNLSLNFENSKLLTNLLPKKMILEKKPKQITG